MDTPLQRAAYCLGVLTTVIPFGRVIDGQDGRAFYFPPTMSDTDITARMDKEYGRRHVNDPSIPAITPINAEFATLRRQFDLFELYHNLELARVMKSGATGPTYLPGELSLIRGVGARDASLYKTLLSMPLHTFCATRCGVEHAPCIVECVNAQNPTAARILRCLLLPVELQ